jgi:hypothetical protein
LPNSATSIGDFAFEDCSELTSINITGNITSIGDYAFSGCDELIGAEENNQIFKDDNNVYYIKNNQGSCYCLGMS